ncbi:DUF2914 domain-containing protein [Myxococcota bacterium]|nr:DUF2914 domain-containing protein [Myxococcota bacterium]
MTTLPPALDRRLSPRQRDLALRAWPWLAPGAFVGGFFLDALTLRRVDDVGDNLQLTLYLLGAALLLVLERRAWHGRATLGLVARHRGAARLGLQFFFGGLFSAYVIFYSQSATFGPSLLFCLLLAALMLANELWFEDLRPDLPQLALWFFCALSYLLFAVPTWTGQLGFATRFAAGVLALLFSTGLLALVHWGEVVDLAPPREGPPTTFRQALPANLATWSGMWGALLLLIALGAVPPVPLALAEAGVYREVRRDGDQVVLSYERPPWWAPWRDDERVFAHQDGDRVYVFTAVFAPGGAGVRILHAWEHQQEDGSWQETDRIPFDMQGGRDGGWRSWTAKRNVSPGRWRVRVLSEHGDRLGRVDLEIVPREGEARERVERRY